VTQLKRTKARRREHNQCGPRSKASTGVLEPKKPCKQGNHRGPSNQSGPRSKEPIAALEAKHSSRPSIVDVNGWEEGRAVVCHLLQWVVSGSSLPFLDRMNQRTGK